MYSIVAIARWRVVQLTEAEGKRVGQPMGVISAYGGGEVVVQRGAFGRRVSVRRGG